MSRITIEEFAKLAASELPFAGRLGLSVDAIGEGTATGRLSYRDGLLRPGGTLAGPALMALADLTMYAAVLSVAGKTPLAVTTNLNINFLRKPGPADIRADCRVLKAGKRLVVLEVGLFTEGEAEPVAHVTGTYSIPPAR
jgi:uncharacterized protein (TIGR00369 family)